MGLDGLSSQTYQAYQHVGGKPAVSDISGALANGKALAHRNAAEQWATNSLTLGVRQGIAHKLDKAGAKKASGGSAISKTGTVDANNSIGQKLDRINVSQAKATPMPSQVAPRGYSHWLGLGSKQLDGAKNWNWNDIKQTASSNVSQFGKELKAGNFSSKAFVKETLFQRNFQPVKDVFTGKFLTTTASQAGQSLLATAGVGLVGFDVLKHTNDTYKDSKSKESSGKGNKLDTAKETAGALGKYALRDAVSWETAGAGFALGKAILPMSIMKVPIGGVLMAALGGVVAQKGMNVILKTGEHDPVQQRKALEKARKKMEKENKLNLKQ